MSTDTQRLATDAGIWKIERTEESEQITDPLGRVRYHGRHSATATHLAGALRREDEYREACVKVLDECLRVGSQNPEGASVAIARIIGRLRAVLKAGPEFWTKLDIPPRHPAE